MSRVLQPNVVADYLLSFAAEHGDVLTNLKLQKLLYYAEAWHLALFGEPLTNADFEAWVHGPVHPETYRRFKVFGHHPITEAYDPDPDVPEDKQAFLNDVFAAYGSFSAYDLERMTHREEPWIEARGDLGPLDPSQDKLSRKTMESFYRARLDED